MGLFRLNTSAFIVCYSLGKDAVVEGDAIAQLGTCNIGVVEGENKKISFSLPYVFHSSSSVDEITFAALSDSNLLVCYVNEVHFNT